MVVSFKLFYYLCPRKKDNQRKSMMKKVMMIAVMTIVVTAMHAQQVSDAVERYIVKTASAVDNRVKANNNTEANKEEAEEPKDFISQRFRYVSVCDWQPGMRFMVIPTQKDLVVKTFTETSTGHMIPSTVLRYKIMIYKGNSNPNKALHERMDFVLEEDTTKAYYYEVPTASFSDFCYSKAGVPTLAYLGDVDTAIRELTGKQVKVLARDMYQDTEMVGEGYKAVDLFNSKKQGEVMTIVKVGVGTRNFPVKIIVKDRDSIEYFQTVAISRTNSGMRDEEFEMSNVLPHTFAGAFELVGDKMAVPSEYLGYIGKEFFTLQQMEMRDSLDKKAIVSRLSTFVIKDMSKRVGTEYFTLTLEGQRTHKTYTCQVLMNETDVIGQIAGKKEEHFGRLFKAGDPMKLPGVDVSHLADLRKGVIRNGFTEEEVWLAMGDEPSSVSDVKGGTYSWTYQYPNRPFCSIVFNANTKKVKSVTK